MKGLSIVGVSVVLAFASLNAAYGDFVADFEGYNIGDGLVTATPGTWHYWGNGSTGGDVYVQADPTDANNMVANLTSEWGDVVTAYFPDILADTGKARVSWDVYLTGGTDGVANYPPQVNIGPGSKIDDATYTGVLSTYFSEGDPNAQWSPGGTSLSANAWHHVEVFAEKSGTDINYTYAVDGTPLTGVMDVMAWQTEGVNGIELGMGSGDGDANTFVLVDNLKAQSIPEPATLAMLVTGVIGVLGGVLLRRRRHAR